MRPVWQRLVDALVSIRRHEWRDDEVDVAEEEEDYNGQRRTEWRRPVPLLLMRVQPQQCERDESVDNGERVGDDTASWSASRDVRTPTFDLLQDEVVGVARRRCKHDDHRDKPVLEETCQWCVEGSV